MSTPTGTKIISNKGLLRRALDVHDGVPVGNLQTNPVPLSQKWTITERHPHGFVIFNSSSQKYLGYEGDDPDNMKPVLSDEEHIWEIVFEGPPNLYRIEVPKETGYVCSLKSPGPNTPIVFDNFLSQNEEWIVADTTPPPPGTGMRKIRSDGLRQVDA